MNLVAAGQISSFQAEIHNEFERWCAHICCKRDHVATVNCAVLRSGRMGTFELVSVIGMM
jgi:hypothetical protein